MVKLYLNQRPHLHLYTKGGGQSQESKTILDVVFKKEDGDWKIGEIK